jgi:hypothetical protein
VVETRVPEADGLVGGRGTAHLRSGVSDTLKRFKCGRFEGMGGRINRYGGGDVGARGVCEEHGVGVGSQGEPHVLDTLIGRGVD